MSKMMISPKWRVFTICFAMQLMLVINIGIGGITIGQDGILEFHGYTLDSCTPTRAKIQLTTRNLSQACTHVEFFEYLGYYMRNISWLVVIMHIFFALAHPMKPTQWTGVVTVLAFCSWVIYFLWLPMYDRA